jgi:transposase
VNQAVLAVLNPEQVEVEIWRSDELEVRRGLSSELDGMWSFVKTKANPRWLWHAMDHHTGKVLYGFCLAVSHISAILLSPPNAAEETMMRKAMPSITESADEWQRRMKSDPDLKKRQRLHAWSLAASGQARQRPEIAALLGVHRHSVAAWLAAYAEGGLDHALRYQRPQPPVHQRITATALTALQEKLHAPHGFAGYHQMRVWLAEEPQVTLASSSVHALVRDKLHAKPKRPRPAHAKKPQTQCPSFRLPCPVSSRHSAKTTRRSTRSRSLRKTKPAWAYGRSAGVGLPPTGSNLWPPSGPSAIISISMARSHRPRGRTSFSHCRISTAVRSNSGWTASPPLFRNR